MVAAVSSPGAPPRCGSSTPPYGTPLAHAQLPCGAGRSRSRCGQGRGAASAGIRSPQAAERLTWKWVALLLVADSFQAASRAAGEAAAHGGHRRTWHAAGWQARPPPLHDGLAPLGLPHVNLLPPPPAARFCCAGPGVQHGRRSSHVGPRMQPQQQQQAPPAAGHSKGFNAPAVRPLKPLARRAPPRRRPLPLAFARAGGVLRGAALAAGLQHLRQKLAGITATGAQAQPGFCASVAATAPPCPPTRSLRSNSNGGSDGCELPCFAPATPTMCEVQPQRW